MPTYQYACTACDHRFEAVQSFTDPSLSDCPECSGRLRKLYGSVGVVFKGSGFYRTDSRASAEQKNGSNKGKESSSGDSGGSSGSSGSSASGSSGSSEKSSSSSSGSNSSSSSSGTSSSTAKAS